MQLPQRMQLFRDRRAADIWFVTVRPRNPATELTSLQPPRHRPSSTVPARHRAAARTAYHTCKTLSFSTFAEHAGFTRAKTIRIVARRMGWRQRQGQSDHPRPRSPATTHRPHHHWPTYHAQAPADGRWRWRGRLGCRQTTLVGRIIYGRPAFMQACHAWACKLGTRRCRVFVLGRLALAEGG